MINKGCGHLRKMRRRISNTKGTSLVEMLICVLLFTLAFMAGTAGLVYAVNSTTAVARESDGQKVSDTILSRVEGELADMAKEGSVYMVFTGGSTSSPIIEFTGGSGIPVYICNSEGGLLIHYWPTKVNESINDRYIAGSDWTFDSGVYKDYEIEDLQFTKGSHNGKLTITTALTLKNTKSGKTLETTRTVCCYNREDADVNSDRYSSEEDIKANNPAQTGG